MEAGHTKSQNQRDGRYAWPLGNGRYRGFKNGSRILVRFPMTRRRLQLPSAPGYRTPRYSLRLATGFLPDADNTTELEMDSERLVQFNDEFQTGEGVTSIQPTSNRWHLSTQDSRESDASYPCDSR